MKTETSSWKSLKHVDVWIKRRLIFLKVQHFAVIIYFEYFKWSSTLKQCHFQDCYAIQYFYFIQTLITHLQQSVGVFQLDSKKWGYCVIQWFLYQINLGKTFLWITCAAKLEVFIFALWYREKWLYKAERFNEEQKLWSNPENSIYQRLKQSHKSALNKAEGRFNL